VLLVALLAGSPAPVAAGEDARAITVTVAVCPAGGETPPLARCEPRRARAFAVSVLDADAARLADDVAPGAAGEARAPLDAPADLLQVIVQTAVTVGSRDVACEVDGEPVAAELGGGAAAIPVFDLALPPQGDVECVVYLYGFPGDTDALAIAAAAGTPAATPRGPLPATPEAALAAPGRGHPCSRKDAS
jgi:hypothetical protein